MVDWAPGRSYVLRITHSYGAMFICPLGTLLDISICENLFLVISDELAPGVGDHVRHAVVFDPRHLVDPLEHFGDLYVDPRRPLPRAPRAPRRYAV